MYKSKLFFLLIMSVLLFRCEERIASNPVDSEYLLIPPELYAAFIDEQDQVKLSWNNSDGDPESFQIYKQVNSKSWDRELLEDAPGELRQLGDIAPSISDTCFYDIEANWYGKISRSSNRLSIMSDPNATRYYHFTDNSISREALALSSNELLASVAIRDVRGNTYERSLLVMFDKYANQRWKLQFLDPSPPKFTLMDNDRIAVSSGNRILLYDRLGQELSRTDFDPILTTSLAGSGDKLFCLLRKEVDLVLSSDYTLLTMDFSTESSIEENLWQNQNASYAHVSSFPNGDILLSGIILKEDTGSNSTYRTSILQRRDSENNEIWTKEIPRKLCTRPTPLNEDGFILLEQDIQPDAPLFLVKFDGLGEPAWSTELVTPRDIVQVIVLIDGILVLYHDAIQFVQKYDLDGALLWESNEDIGRNHRFTSLAELSQGRVALLGLASYDRAGNQNLFIRFLDENEVSP